jgi:hypothetical protein
MRRKRRRRRRRKTKNENAKGTRLFHKQRMSCHAKLCLRLWSMLRVEPATFQPFEPHGRGDGPRLTEEVLIIDGPGSTDDHREHSEIRTRRQIHRTLVEIGAWLNVISITSEYAIRVRARIVKKSRPGSWKDKGSTTRHISSCELSLE